MKVLNVCGMEIIVDNNLDIFISNNIEGTTTVTVKGRTAKERTEKESNPEEDYMTVLDAIIKCRISGKLATISGMEGRRIRMQHPRFKKIVEKMADDGIIEAFVKNNATAYKITAKGHEYIETGIYYTKADVVEQTNK